MKQNRTLVGITYGLLSAQVQGLAREMHLLMLPLAIVGIGFLGIETWRTYRSRADRSLRAVNRETIIVLQFFVAGLVTLGGVAYAKDGTYPFGTILGLIHLAVGITGIFAGYAFLKSKDYSRKFLFAINGVTIAYSAFSESLAQIYSFLLPGINDSLIGTIVAMILSAAIICLLLQSGSVTTKVISPEANLRANS